METGVVEQVLRALPGVLDCSVDDEGIAIVVHPEVDPRVLELRAQVALAEIGERRPLLVVGGMSSGAVEPAPAGWRRGRAGRSPVSLLGFAVLVVSLITVVPIAGGRGGGGGGGGGDGAVDRAALPAPGAAGVPLGGVRGGGAVPVVGESERPAAVAFAEAVTASVVRRPPSAGGPDVVAMAAAPGPAVVPAGPGVPVAAAAGPGAGVGAGKGRGQGKGQVKAKGKHADDGVTTLAAASGKPHKPRPPTGRR